MNIPTNDSKANLQRSLLITMRYFLAAYLVVDILATALAFTVIWILKLPTAGELGISRVNDPGWLLSRPYIVVINLLCWTIFADLDYRKRLSGPVLLLEALGIALLWLVSAMVLDFVFFVLIPTPISLTAHEFYIDDQPWITLTYISILAGHIIYYLLRRFRLQKMRS